jgi:hypothetical protein
VIGIEFRSTFGTQNWSTVPGGKTCHLPFFGAASFLAFIDSRNR